MEIDLENMENILANIVAQKKLEIKHLYAQYPFDQLEKEAREEMKDATASIPLFYQALADSRRSKKPFFIAEFKRKSPSEGWINREVDLPAQIRAYAQAGAGAISVLTDSPFFGGSYADLALAAATLEQWLLVSETQRPLLLQKDFVLDPIQLYLAKRHGADLILLIAAILEPVQLENLRRLAESIGLGVLVEVHDAAELERIRHLEFPVLGVNNRDLKTFRTALNRSNVLSRLAGERFLIAESGLRDYRDFQVVRTADGFLIGTSLMQDWSGSATSTFAAHFQAAGRLLFKACGIRTAALLENTAADYLGINFSPLSKRRPDAATLAALKNLLSFPAHLVAVFYQNTEAGIRAVLADYPFKIIQLYAHDVTPEFVRSLRQKVLLACAVHTSADLERLELFAADVDLFILDGASPGSGEGIRITIPADFPYPFLLAGGIHLDNLPILLAHPACIGVDVASGLETAGQVDPHKIQAIADSLATFSPPVNSQRALNSVLMHGDVLQKNGSTTLDF